MAQLEEPKKTVSEKEANKINLEFQRKQDRTPIRGKFIFHEVPGGRMEFTFRKYKGDQMEKFSFADGEVATIPLGVYKHLNTNCWYPSYAYKSDEVGRPTMSVSEKIRRCSFQSLEFLDIDGLSGSALPK